MRLKKLLQAIMVLLAITAASLVPVVGTERPDLNFHLDCKVNFGAGLSETGAG